MGEDENQDNSPFLSFSHCFVRQNQCYVRIYAGSITDISLWVHWWIFWSSARGLYKSLSYPSVTYARPFGRYAAYRKQSTANNPFPQSAPCLFSTLSLDQSSWGDFKLCPSVNKAEENDRRDWETIGNGHHGTKLWLRAFPVVFKRQKKQHMENQRKQHKEACMSMLLPKYYSDHKSTVKGVALWPRGYAGLND